MALPTCIVDTCEVANQAYNEAASLLDAGELQKMLASSSGLVKQWVIKARCYQNANEFFTAMMYYGMSIWHVCFTEEDADKKAKVSKKLKDQMQQCRTALERQWAEQHTSTGKDDEPVRQFEAEDEKTLVNKVTGAPLNFTSLSGGDRVKEVLRTKFIYPNIFPDLYFSEVNNVLLYGPPGTGKTLLARACAGEIQRIGGGGLVVHFFALSGSEVRSKWEGGTERNINGLFKQANALAVKTMEQDKGKKAKSVIFIDEVESLASKRGGDTSDRALTTLLQEMDGFKSHPNVIVLAATNRPWDLDSAFLRRFSASVLVDLEDFEGRVSLIADQVFDRFQKKDMDLPSRLCSLTVSETPDSKCDETWNSYKEMYMRNDVTIEEYFTGFTDLTKEQAYYFLRFLGIEFPESNNFLKIELPLNLYIKGKVLEYTSKIEDSIDIINGVCNSDCNKLNDGIDNDGLITAMILFHYMADLTGPSIDAVKSGWVDRKPSHLAISSWGYSNSDLTRLMKEVFSNTAYRIIYMKFNNSNCKDETSDCSGYKCFKENSNGSYNYIEARVEAKNDEKNFILQKTNGEGDVYSELTISDFCNALNNRSIATTTGTSNEYCHFVEYNQGGGQTPKQINNSTGKNPLCKRE